MKRSVRFLAAALALAAALGVTRASVLTPQKDSAGVLHIPTLGGTYDATGGAFGFTPSVPAPTPVSTTPIIALAAPGAVAATLGTSQFTLVNPGTGAATATVSQAAANGPFSLSDPAHGNQTNVRMLVAKMTGQSATYTGRYSNNGSNSLYNNGMVVLNPASGVLTELRGVYANTSGTDFQIQQMSNPQGLNGVRLPDIYNSGSNGGNNQATYFATVGTPIFGRIGFNAADQTIHFAVSPTGFQGTFTELSSQPVATVGNPTEVGFFEDADPTGGDGYSGVLAATVWEATGTFDMQHATAGGDPLAAFDVLPNIPLNGNSLHAMPTNAAVTLPAGLSFSQGGGTQLVGMIFGSATPSANITTDQAVDDNFYSTYLEGSNNIAIGSPMDTGQGNNATFAGVARHYPPGNPARMATIRPDGLYLTSHCSDIGYTDCRPGHVYGGLAVEAQTGFRPGEVLVMRTKMALGLHVWSPPWGFSVEEQPPLDRSVHLAPSYDGGSAKRWACASENSITPGACSEQDYTDYFARPDLGITPGHQINFGLPDIYGANWDPDFFPSFTYGSVGSGYEVHTGGPDALNSDQDLSTQFITQTINWRLDGHLDLFYGSKLIATAYQDTSKFGHHLDANGNTVVTGMEILFSAAQAIPGFRADKGNDPTGQNLDVKDNDGIVDGWTLGVQQFAIFQGNIANQDSFQNTATSAYAPGHPVLAAPTVGQQLASFNGAPFYDSNFGNAQLSGLGTSAVTFSVAQNNPAPSSSNPNPPSNSNKHALLTPFPKQAGSTTFVVTSSTPVGTFLNDGIAFYGNGGFLSALANFSFNGGSYEFDRWRGFNSSFQQQYLPNTVESWAAPGVKHCIKVVFDGNDALSLYGEPFNGSAGLCPQGGYVSLVNVSYAALGHPPFIGLMVDALNTNNVNLGASIVLGNYFTSTSTNPQDASPATAMTSATPGGSSSSSSSGSTPAPSTPPSSAPTSLALGGAVFTPTSSVTTATATQASSTAPIVVTAPWGGGGSNKQGFLTPLQAHGSYTFKVRNTTPGTFPYNAGLMLLGGNTVSTVAAFNNTASGSNLEIDNFPDYANDNQVQRYPSTMQAIAASGVEFCERVVFDGSNDTFLIEAENSAGGCPQGGWTQLGQYPANDFGTTGSVGVYVDPWASANGGAASIAIDGFTFIANGGLQDAA